MAIEFTDRSGSLCIILSDVIDISQAAELKQILVQALQSNAQTRIEVSRANAIDLTVVQLLCAAVSYASAAGVALEIEGAWSEEVERSLSCTGLTPILESLRTHCWSGGVDVLAARH